MAMRLNVQYGLVATEGVYAAIPYKFAKTPVHDARYSNVDAAGILTVLASLHTAHLSAAATAALDRALVEVRGKGTVPRDERTRRLLYAVLVALPQVVFYENQTVVSFLDVIGIANAFAAFSGTMAFGLPLPAFKDARRRYVPEEAGGLLAVAPDVNGIELVERHVVNARREFVAGEPGPDRAAAVVRLLKARAEARPEALGARRQMVIVDACGEFGMVDSAFLRAARTFTASGELGEGGDVVYYEHKHSRGTDAVLAADADGCVVIDNLTTLTCASQAFYRLRGIDYGRQTVTFYVCGAKKMDGAALYELLAANDEARSLRSAVRGAMQEARAAMPKAGYSDFIFKNETSEDVGGTQTSQNQQTNRQTNRQQQQSVTIETNRCVNAKGDPTDIDPFVLYSAAEYGERHLEVSKLLGALRDTNVGVSPLLMYAGENPTRVEHAFAVLRTKPPTVVLCALVEVWAVAPDDSKRRPAASFYAKGGMLLRGSDAAAGDVLFGRYLCGDVLAYPEQRALLQHLKGAYAAKEEQIYKVLSCLRLAGLIENRSGLLHGLSTTTQWASQSEVEPPQVALVRAILDGSWPVPYGVPRRRQFIV